MTTNEFIEELKATKKKFVWRVENTEDQDRERIRTKIKNVDLCPITAVCFLKTGKVFGEGRYDLAAENIGLDGKDAYTIARAADNEDSINNIRDRMMKALFDN